MLQPLDGKNSYIFNIPHPDRPGTVLGQIEITVGQDGLFIDVDGRYIGAIDLFPRRASELAQYANVSVQFVVHDDDSGDDPAGCIQWRYGQPPRFMYNETAITTPVKGYR